MILKPKAKLTPTPAGLCPELHCPQRDVGCSTDCVCPPCGPDCPTCAEARRKLDRALTRGLPRRPPAGRLFDPDDPRPQE